MSANQEILSSDIEGDKIQGFEPRDIISTTGAAAEDISGYMAFRVSADVDYQFTISGGTITTASASLSKNSITVCKNMESVTFAADVVIEVM